MKISTSYSTIRPNSLIRVGNSSRDLSVSEKRNTENSNTNKHLLELPQREGVLERKPRPSQAVNRLSRPTQPVLTNQFINWLVVIVPKWNTSVFFAPIYPAALTAMFTFNKPSFTRITSVSTETTKKRKQH